MRVVAEECLPTLRRRSTLHHVFRDRRLGDLKAEHQQLSMDPRCSPLWVFFAHPSDKIAQLASDLWPPCSLPRFPTPKRRKTSTIASEGWSSVERHAPRRLRRLHLVTIQEASAHLQARRLGRRRIATQFGELPYTQTARTRCSCAERK